jgi:hypothetical protein
MSYRPACTKETSTTAFNPRIGANPTCPSQGIGRREGPELPIRCVALEQMAAIPFGSWSEVQALPGREPIPIAFVHELLSEIA